MPKIQVIIATYNRPKHITVTVESVLKQTFDDFELLISDNSSNNDTQKVLKGIKDDRITYKRRVPSLPVIDHLNAILQDVSSEFFMIFHDDDIMYTNMIEELLGEITKHDTALAIGSNAFLNKHTKTTKKLFLKTAHKLLLLKSPDEIAYRYLIDNGIVPFPSYLYKKIVAKKFYFNIEHGGKYCDAAFVMDIASLGTVIFLNKPLMEYYIHQQQDSKQVAFLQKIKLINYIYKTTSFNKNDYLIKKIRIDNIYNTVKQNILNENFSIPYKRYFKILFLMFKISPFGFFIKTLLISIYSIPSLYKTKRSL